VATGYARIFIGIFLFWHSFQNSAKSKNLIGKIFHLLL